MAISKQQFPEQFAKLNPVTWALTCLLHDLGTAEENLTATRMSFDIYGGIKAIDVLKGYGATVDQAEARGDEKKNGGVEDGVEDLNDEDVHLHPTQPGARAPTRNRMILVDGCNALPSR